MPTDCRLRLRYVLCLTLLLATIGCEDARAHDPRPLLIELDTRSGETLSLRWKTPASISYEARPVVEVDSPCNATAPLAERRLGDAYAGERQYRCPAGSAPVSILIRYRGPNPSLATVVRRISPDGTEQVLLQPGVTKWQAPVGATPPPAAGYLRLGIVHILAGTDHLLFLVCLMILAGTLRRMLIAVTGFTIAHSLTLALATFGLVTVPVVFVEALIALSIVFLAAEIVRADRATLAWRYPGSVAFLFGLLHGLGFANVLGHIGLPAGEATLSLLLFNVGVEVGQLVFLFGLAALAWLVHRLRRPVEPLRWTIVASGCGIAAAFWTVERIAQFG